MSANSLTTALADTNTETAPILKMLGIFTEGATSFNAEAALLSYGRPFRPVEHLPTGLHKGPSGQCFKNCTRALMPFVGTPNPPFLYAEGYALDAELGIPYQHAWLVNAAGRAIDLTWQETDGAVYYGVTFKLPFVLEAMRSTEVYGVLFNPGLHDRLFSDPAGFQATLCRPGLPGLPRGQIT